MSWSMALLVTTVLLVVTLGMGQWIAFALGTVGVAILVLSDGWAATSVLSSIAWNSVDSFVLTAIPLFVFMGEIIMHSGLSERFYSGLLRLVHRLPGGTLHSNVGAAAVFSAISGSSVATALAVGTVAMPEMDRQGYDRRLALTTLAGGGSLGQLIPPSIAMLVYASQVQVSVSRLFAAGLIPGLALAAMMNGYVVLRVMMNPSLAPRAAALPTGRRAWMSILGTLPLVVLICLTLGVIYGGLATPTEAAAAGAAGALVLALAFGHLDRPILAMALRKTIELSCMIIALVVGAQVLSAALVRTGVSRGLVAAVSDLGLAPFALFLVLLIAFGILGTFIDSISLMLLTLPVLLPVLQTAGFDLLWFGVIMMILIEFGQLTPPVGMVLYVLRGVSPDSSLGAILHASIPIQIILMAMALLLYAFPDLALWLADRVAS